MEQLIQEHFPYAVVKRLKSAHDLLIYFPNGKQVILMIDLEQKEISGLHLLYQIKQNPFLTKAVKLVLSHHCDTYTLRTSIKLGAQAFIHKENIPLIPQALNSLNRQPHWFCPTARQFLHYPLAKKYSMSTTINQQLSKSQLNVLECLYEVYQVNYMAKILCNEISTVRYHLRKLFDLLHCANLTTLLRNAIKMQICRTWTHPHFENDPILLNKPLSVHCQKHNLPFPLPHENRKRKPSKKKKATGRKMKKKKNVI
jgi:DNA-binding NarL/FixJ family response regulator